jgi:hypothetical protein
VNGYVDASGAIRSRPGTVQEVALPAGTKGLMAYDDKLYVFASDITSTGNALFECLVLKHPTDDTQNIAKIHFAAPFLGYPYVVCEFDSGEVYHYWLEGQINGDTWTANTAYTLGQIVKPTTPNGYSYRATRLGDPKLKWAAGVERTVNDEIEATIFDGNYYKCTAAEGSPARSGTAEPTWNTDPGALTYENVDLAGPTAPGTGPTTGDFGGSSGGGGSLPPYIGERYPPRLIE